MRSNRRIIIWPNSSSISSIKSNLSLFRLQLYYCTTRKLLKSLQAKSVAFKINIRAMIIGRQSQDLLIRVVIIWVRSTVAKKKGPNLRPRCLLSLKMTSIAKSFCRESNKKWNIKLSFWSKLPKRKNRKNRPHNDSKTKKNDICKSLMSIESERKNREEDHQ